MITYEKTGELSEALGDLRLYECVKCGELIWLVKTRPQVFIAHNRYVVTTTCDGTLMVTETSKARELLEKVSR
jgi:hypothetical protein